jgi:hypothetical protein
MPICQTVFLPLACAVASGTTIQPGRKDVFLAAADDCRVFCLRPYFMQFGVDSTGKGAWTSRSQGFSTFVGIGIDQRRGRQSLLSILRYIAGMLKTRMVR